LQQSYSSAHPSTSIDVWNETVGNACWAATEVHERPMFIGVCTIEVHVPESGSLKTKRHSIRSLKDRIRNKFNVSVAEIEDNDLWQKASLAVAAVSNDKAHLNQTLDHVLNMVRGVPEIDLLDFHIEIF
jgi:uncharacterized protein YlxP (DUF503 family)